MARILTCGYGIGVLPSADTTTGDALDGRGTGTLSTNVIRNPIGRTLSLTASGGIGQFANHYFTGSTANIYYARFYYRWLSSIPATATVFNFGAASSVLRARTNASGNALQLYNLTGSAQIGSDSASIVADTWYLIEVRCKTGSGAGNGDQAELRLNGTSVAVSNSLNLTSSPLAFGSMGQGTTGTVYVSDFALNDSTGTNQNSWVGPGYTALLLPISDNAISGWTGGAGGTSNLWQAVHNTPPAGTTYGSGTNTSQIRNQQNNATDNYDANLTTYANAGVPADAVINLVQALAVHGESGALSLSGALLLVSNPAQGSEDTFLFGGNLGAQGAWGTLASYWACAHGTAQYGDISAANRSVSPVLRLGRRTASTTQYPACCCLAAYVDYGSTWIGGPPQGGVRFGGQATLTATFPFAPRGGLRFGSSATLAVTFPQQPQGGLRLGSRAGLTQQTYTLPAQGGLRFGGSVGGLPGLPHAQGGLRWGGRATVGIWFDPLVVWGGNNQNGTSFRLSGGASGTTYLPGPPATGSFLPSDFLLQDGQIAEVNIAIAASGSFTLKLFRPNATTPTNYDWQGDSAPLTAIGTGLQSFTPSGLPNCRPGDILGVYLPTGGAQIWGTTVTGLSLLSLAGNITSSNTTFTGSQTGAMNVQVLGPAPFVAITGDSISVGSSNNATLNYIGYFDFQGGPQISGPSGDLAHCPGFQLHALNASYTYQTLGKFAAYWSFMYPSLFTGSGLTASAQANVVEAHSTAIIIHCGINDARANDTGAAGTWTWAGEVLPALNSIKALLQPGQHLFIDEILPLSSGPSPTALTFNANFATWCAANGATLIPMAAAFSDSNGHLASQYDDGSGIHLSQAGVNLMAQLWNNALQAYYSAPAYITTSYNNIPNFGRNPSIQSVASGSWSNAATWSPARIPQAGDVVSITGGTTVSYDSTSNAILNTVTIQSGGSLVFRTDVNTSLTLVNLLVLAGGALQIGTVASPVAANVTAQVIFADQTINTTTDPEQYGNGLIALGTVTMCGASKAMPFLRLAAEPLAGATTLTLSQPAPDWHAGDALCLPDTRQLLSAERGASYVNQSEFPQIQSIAPGNTVLTLAAPLQYTHAAARDHAGTINFYPHVGNLTRNIVFRSANPAGTRGYLFLTARATVDIRYVEFADLGRTNLATEDDTTFDTSGNVTHVGTNQNDRCPVTFLHLMGPTSPPANGYQFTFLGNAVCGTVTASQSILWPILLHDANYGLIQDNVVSNAAGAGLLTESGAESYHVIQHNFVCAIYGNISWRYLTYRYGGGFHIRNYTNQLANNVAAGCVQDGSVDYLGGIGFALESNDTGVPDFVKVPLFPGADMTQAGQYQTLDMRLQRLALFSGNESYGAMAAGLVIQVLGTDRDQNLVGANPMGTVLNFTTWHTWDYAFYNEGIQNVIFDGYVVRGQARTLPADGGNAWTSKVWAGNITIQNSDIQGMLYGIGPYTANNFGTFTIQNSVFCNYTANIVCYTPSSEGTPIPASTYQINSVQFIPYPGAPSFVSILMDYETTGFISCNVIVLTQVFVSNYNLGGSNFQVFWSQQASTFVVPQTVPSPSGSGLAPYLQGSPVAGLTNAQNWATYGIAIAGAVAPGGTTTLAEIPNGILFSSQTTNVRFGGGGVRFGSSVPYPAVQWTVTSRGGIRFGSRATVGVRFTVAGQGGLRLGGHTILTASATISRQASGGLRFGGSTGLPHYALALQARGGLRFGSAAQWDATGVTSNYFAPRYWTSRYWARRGSQVIPGPGPYWTPKYWARRFFGQYQPARPTTGQGGVYFTSKFWTRRYWPWYGRGGAVVGPGNYWAPTYWTLEYWPRKGAGQVSGSNAALWTFRPNTFLPWTFRPLYARGGQAAYLLPAQGGIRFGSTAKVNVLPPNLLPRTASGGIRFGSAAKVTVSYPLLGGTAQGGIRFGSKADVAVTYPIPFFPVPAQGGLRFGSQAAVTVTYATPIYPESGTGGLRFGSRADVAVSYPFPFFPEPTEGGLRFGSQADVAVQYPTPFFPVSAQGGIRFGSRATVAVVIIRPVNPQSGRGGIRFGSSATVAAVIPSVPRAAGGLRFGGHVLPSVFVPSKPSAQGGLRFGSMATYAVLYPGITEFADGTWRDLDTDRGLLFWEPSRGILWRDLDTTRGIVWEEEMESLVKRSGELRTYSFEFRDYAEIQGGDSLNGSVSVTADMPGLAIGTPISVGSQVRVIVAGGTPDTIYKLTAQVSTGGGSILQLNGELVVRDD